MEEMTGRIEEVTRANMSGGLQERERQNLGGGIKTPFYHPSLDGRNFPDQHPISAITGLQSALDGKQPVGNYATTAQLQAETTARQSADASLSTAIDVETTDRQTADSQLQDNITSEETARQNADTNLQTQINGKQPTIADLDTIRANATAGKNASTTIATYGNIVTHNTSEFLPSSTKYGNSVSLTIDSSTYVITLILKDQDGNQLGASQTVDLPLETVVVSGRYDAVNKMVILTLKNGSEISFSVADLVSGLQTEITSSNKLASDLVDDTNQTNKFVTSAEKSDWNGKMAGNTKYGKSLSVENATLSLKDQDGTVLSTVQISVESIQKSVLPTAGSAEANKIYQYVGTTNANHTNGYFYKCQETVITAPVQESLVVTQTAGDSLGAITTNIGLFKAAIGYNDTYTYTLRCVGKPHEIAMYKNVNGVVDTDTFTRDSTNDIPQLRQYGWVDSNANWYFTNTELPNLSTTFYIGDTENIGTPTNVASEWECRSVESRQIDGMGIWVFSFDLNTQLYLADYGIYISSAGMIGDVLSVAYTAPVVGESAYQWQQINVQPQSSTTGLATTNLDNLSETGEAHFAKIEDTSTTSLTNTWSASKLNTTIGNIETLILAL